MTIEQAIARWYSGFPVQSGNVSSPDGKEIYSYGELIAVCIELAPQGLSRAAGQATTCRFLIFDRTAKGKFVSKTTSKHTKLVHSYIEAVSRVLGHRANSSSWAWVSGRLLHPLFEGAYQQWKSDSFDARLARLRQIKGQGGWSGHDVIYWWLSFSTVYSEHSTDQEVVLRDYASGMRPGHITDTDPVFRQLVSDVLQQNLNIDLRWPIDL